MQHESNPHDDDAWEGELITSTPPARSRPMSEVWTVDRPREEEGIRLKRLLWVFTVLIIVLVSPSIVYKIEYSLTSARERARLDVARANLKDFRLDVAHVSADIGHHAEDLAESREHAASASECECHS